MRSQAIDGRSAPKCQGKWPDQPLTTVPAARCAGGRPYLASGLQEGRKSGSIHACSGVIWGIPVQQQKDALEGQLAELQGYVSSKAAGVVRTVMQVPRTGKRAKAKPKYQSKKNKSLKWSGRGVTPVWMREEMKGTKLKKDDFLIK